VLTAEAVMDTEVRGDEADCGCETAAPATPFTELCALSARLSHPVAVLDGERRLVGVVPRQRLVGFLSGSGTEAGDPVPCDRPGDTHGKKVISRA
jgi:glycine betaine/proline transport system ATP-binding protein